MYLIDTDVLSALRRRERHPAIARWIRDQPENDMHISVVTVGEIERAICRQERANPAFARALGWWLDNVIVAYAERIIGVDLPVIRRWGRLSATIGHAGADLLIVATALERGLTVVTRNVRHYAATGVDLLDPAMPVG